MSADPHANDSKAEPLILCANDDGFSAEGLVATVRGLSKLGRVVVVAPETEQSAMSHSLTLHRPLRMRAVGPDQYALDGTPADCVYVALHLPISDGVLPRKPDLVVSGINRGPNLGQDVFYSGTVAAAREGALRGIPAIAASGDLGPNGTFDPQPIVPLVVSLAEAMLQSHGTLTEQDRPTARSAGGRGAILCNLNAPAGPLRGLRCTSLGNRLWDEQVEVRTDPRGRTYYWIGGRGLGHQANPGSDTEAHDAGFASLSLLNLDLGRADASGQQLLAELAAASEGRWQR